VANGLRSAIALRSADAASEDFIGESIE